MSWLKQFIDINKPTYYTLRKLAYSLILVASSIQLGELYVIQLSSMRGLSIWENISVRTFLFALIGEGMSMVYPLPSSPFGPRLIRNTESMTITSIQLFTWLYHPHFCFSHIHVLVFLFIPISFQSSIKLYQILLKSPNNFSWLN